MRGLRLDRHELAGGLGDAGLFVPVAARPAERGVGLRVVGPTIIRDMAAPAEGPLTLVDAARRAGVTDERVLEAISGVPRVAYVPPERAGDAHLDVPVPIARGQVTTQPSLVARMIAGLGLKGDERVLEVGAGLGYQSALLAKLAREVWSVERWPDLAEAARANLAREGVRDVEIVVGDGSEGLPDRAPFDAIVVSAAFPRVPDPLAEQLTDGGRLVMPIGPGGSEEVVAFVNRAGELTRVSSLTGARFVRLVGRHGY